uniref:Secreted protein n=1 Tax=Picea sitchensis TaxID=3332 RepID=A9P067_PICSI|nr:unknown [Picea sitchensis]
MPRSAFVLIVLFWALLMLVTPTLIRWSSAANTSSPVYSETMAFRGERKVEIRTRRILVPAVYSAAAPYPANTHVHGHFKGS